MQTMHCNRCPETFALFQRLARGRRGKVCFCACSVLVHRLIGSPWCGERSRSAACHRTSAPRDAAGPLPLPKCVGSRNAVADAYEARRRNRRGGSGPAPVRLGSGRAGRHGGVSMRTAEAQVGEGVRSSPARLSSQCRTSTYGGW